MESILWTEKYRPKEFNDVMGQEEIVPKIKAFVEQNNMPHVLFVGPAGVGKTTLALVAVRKLFGDSWRENMLELNASDERGIDVVRVKVKDFARTRAIGNVPFKVIYLDECDALTREAQQALRRTMENYSQTCRFILSANYSSKIIDPIQSRCAIFRFKPLKKEQVLALANKIIKNESLELTPQAFDALYDVCHGDCRRLENVLQTCASISKKIDAALIFSMGSVARPKEVHDLLDTALQGKFPEIRQKLVEIMINYSLSGLDLIKQVEQEIWNLKIDDRKKVDLIASCGEAEFRMVEGSDEILQLEAFMAQVAKAGMR